MSGNDEIVKLEVFFDNLNSVLESYIYWVGEIPKNLVISPEILQKLSRMQGFYQRPELNSEVTMYAPVVRYLKLSNCVVTLQEDYGEKFLHFE